MLIYPNCWACTSKAALVFWGHGAAGSRAGHQCPAFAVAGVPLIHSLPSELPRAPGDRGVASPSLIGRRNNRSARHIQLEQVAERIACQPTVPRKASPAAAVGVAARTAISDRLSEETMPPAETTASVWLGRLPRRGLPLICGRRERGAPLRKMLHRGWPSNGTRGDKPGGSRGDGLMQVPSEAREYLRRPTLEIPIRAACHRNLPSKLFPCMKTSRDRACLTMILRKASMPCSLATTRLYVLPKRGSRPE